jgi:hypothetical protein
MVPKGRTMIAKLPDHEEIRMAIHLPRPVEIYFESETARDTEALATCFAPDATVHDEDRTHEGLAARSGPSTPSPRGRPSSSTWPRRASARAPARSDWAIPLPPLSNPFANTAIRIQTRPPRYRDSREGRPAAPR